ncbi:hypothetical protein BV898_06133 [Hypsibius exemplaris]|uniref:G-protein coupled receptors family 1 profile domain-containing protein n=1 Tax=Hypsibius exemplaris TaxID=2072580 RepID=A0A1W0WXJ4_HYPEX|nr:hypothetical protein BV898_06133 [Hypsibius exemplaris]
MNNSLFGINSSFRHANICPLPNFIDNCTVWTQPRSQWIITTTGTILLSLTIMFANIYNLVVFRLWSKKEPYVLFHIVLAVEAVLGGGVSIFAPITRLYDWTNPTRWSHKVCTGGVLLAQFNCLVNVAVISVDRWLSVEFPIPYRNHSNRQRILWTISVAYVIATLHTVVPLVVFPECLLLYCSRQQAFRWLGRSYLLWNYTRGPLFLMIIMLTQARICVIASGAQWVVRTVWESVLPGSMVVMGALVANRKVPTFVEPNATVKTEKRRTLAEATF